MRSYRINITDYSEVKKRNLWEDARKKKKILLAPLCDA